VFGSDLRYGRAGNGWTLVPSDRPYVYVVEGVAPHGPAANAGIRVGDRVDLRALSPPDRSALERPDRGRPLSVSARRGERAFRAAIVPQQRALRSTVWLGYLILAWTAILAGVIAWRRPELPDARLLSLMLSAYVFYIALEYLRLPFAGSGLVFHGVAGICLAVALAALVAFTALFARPLSLSRRILNAIAFASIALSATVAVLTWIGFVTLWFDPIPFLDGALSVLFNDDAQLLVLAAGAAAIVASRGLERQRVSWAVLSMGLLLVIFVTNDLITWLAPDFSGNVTLLTVYNIAGVVAPVGLTYSVLSRRLLDIGFALNRAAVFSGVSIVVIGVFMIVENALGGWLVTVSRAESLAVSVVIALVIGFSIRWIHGYVERFVDGLFFHQRHRSERALRRFAEEAPFVTDRDVLLARTVDEVVRYAEAESATVLMRDADARYVSAVRNDLAAGDAGENDPAILTMRSSGQPVDLHGLGSALRGEYAFPMVARGVLVGALVCGTKRGGEPYAPDERDALRVLAHEVGMALDSFSRERVPLEAAILALPEQLAALRAELQELRTALQRLGSHHEIRDNA
jgi:hypothetical protein